MSAAALTPEVQRTLRRMARALGRNGLSGPFGHCSLRLDADHFLVCAPRPMALIAADEPGTVVPVAGPLPDAHEMHAACAAALDIDDPEAALRTLNEIRLALSFRMALAFHDGRQRAVDCTRQLAQLADAVVDTVLAMAHADLAAAHGQVPGGRFAIIGYGSLGGLELGFGSDLDLVFIHDGDPQAETDGPKPIDGAQFFTRLGQRIIQAITELLNR